MVVEKVVSKDFERDIPEAARTDASTEPIEVD